MRGDNEYMARLMKDAPREIHERLAASVQGLLGKDLLAPFDVPASPPLTVAYVNQNIASGKLGTMARIAPDMADKQLTELKAAERELRDRR